MKKERENLKKEIMLAIHDRSILTRYHAVLFMYGWFKMDNKRSIPFWALDLIDELCYEGFLKP